MCHSTFLMLEHPHAYNFFAFYNEMVTVIFVLISMQILWRNLPLCGRICWRNYACVYMHWLPSVPCRKQQNSVGEPCATAAWCCLWLMNSTSRLHLREILSKINIYHQNQWSVSHLDETLINDIDLEATRSCDVGPLDNRCGERKRILWQYLLDAVAVKFVWKQWSFWASTHLASMLET